MAAGHVRNCSRAATVAHCAALSAGTGRRTPMTHHSPVWNVANDTLAESSFRERRRCRQQQGRQRKQHPALLAAALHADALSAQQNPARVPGQPPLGGA